VLKLEGPVSGSAWRLSRGETLLGDFHAMLHQETAQPLWVPSDTAIITAVHEGDRVTVVDMELSRVAKGEAITRVEEKSGKPDPQSDRPRRFRTGWRFWIPRDAGWIGTQCLWVENTDDTPWRLAEIFYYLQPKLGGDPAKVEPLVGKVPNYYRRGAAWIDAAAGIGVGCWYANEDAFQCYYWKDPGGYLHSDLRQKVEATLDPGQRLPLDAAMAFFYPLDDISLAGFGKAVGALENEVLGKR
jgi:hypothetical protein